MHFGNDPRPGDKQPIMAEKDEYVVNRNAARKHKNLLDFINFVDEPRFDNEEMAHSAIDEAIALNTLSEVSMQNGGAIEDKRNRKTMQSIGVKDELAESLDYFKFIDDILESSRGQSNYRFAKPEREGLGFLEEQGLIDVDRALEHLDNIQKRYQEGAVGFHSPRYQNGGAVSYGNEVSNMPSLSQIYQMAGVQPKEGKQKEAFEKQFSYDPTREQTTVADYTSNIAGLRASGTGKLGTVSGQASQAGAGFAGFGARQGMTSTARKGLESGFQAGRDTAQRDMFKSIRSDRESYIQAALTELRRLEGLEGTVENYESHPGAPSSPEEGDTYTYLTNTYELDGSKCVSLTDDEDEHEDAYSQDD